MKMFVETDADSRLAKRVMKDTFELGRDMDQVQVYTIQGGGPGTGVEEDGPGTGVEGPGTGVEGPGTGVEGPGTGVEGPGT